MTEHPISFLPEFIPAILDGRKRQTRRPNGLAAINENPGDWRIKQVCGVCQPFGAKRPVWRIVFERVTSSCDFIIFDCPFGVPGDRLRVRHAWWQFDKGGHNEQAWDEFTRIIRWPNGQEIRDAEPDLKGWQKRPGIFMPRWVPRIILENTGVKVEQVQDISEADAIAEGVSRLFTPEDVGKPGITGPGGWKNYLWHGGFGQYGMGNRQSDAWPHQFSDYKLARDSYSSLWELLYGKKGLGWRVNPWAWAVSFRMVK